MFVAVAGVNTSSSVRHSDAGAVHPAQPLRDGDRAESGCEHQYVPTTTGTSLTYHWVGSDDEGNVAMRLARWMQRGSGGVALWQIEMESARAPLRAWSIERACDALGAEEPWIGFRTGGVLHARGQTWRLPRMIQVGARFDGTIGVGVRELNLELERSHRVTGRETVATAAGTFDSFVLQVEERSQRATEPIAMTAWVAAGPGLVRLEEGSGPMALRYELVAWESGPARAAD